MESYSAELGLVPALRGTLGGRSRSWLWGLVTTLVSMDWAGDKVSTVGSTPKSYSVEWASEVKGTDAAWAVNVCLGCTFI